MPYHHQRALKVFCVLHAYLDDSGTHAGSPFCLLAGYFGSERHWLRFDRKWRAVLDSFGVEEFHAKPFWSYVNGSPISQYKGWSQERCREFISLLLKVITESERIFPVGCTVEMEEWRSLSFDERSYLTGGTYDKSGKIVKPGAPNKPYFLPFLTAISIVLDYCNPGHIVHFSFDQNMQMAGYAVQYFQQMKSWGNFNDKSLLKYKKMGELTFADSRQATPVQAADLLAFESYRHALSVKQLGIRTVQLGPVLVQAIKNMRDMGDSKMFDKYGLDVMLKTYRSVLGQNKTPL